VVVGHPHLPCTPYHTLPHWATAAHQQPPFFPPTHSHPTQPPAPCSSPPNSLAWRSMGTLGVGQGWTAPGSVSSHWGMHFWGTVPECMMRVWRVTDQSGGVVPRVPYPLTTPTLWGVVGRGEGVALLLLPLLLLLRPVLLLRALAPCLPPPWFSLTKFPFGWVGREGSGMRRREEGGGLPSFPPLKTTSGSIKRSPSPPFTLPLA
jgi:hypothetical protein